MLNASMRRNTASAIAALPTTPYGLKLDLAALKDVGCQVSVTAVPVLSAVWLFGSALLGLAGFTRGKAKAA